MNAVSTKIVLQNYFLFRILSFQFRFLAKFRHWITRRPHVCRKENGPEDSTHVLRCIARAIFPLLVRNQDSSPRSKKKGMFLAMVPISRSMASKKARSVFLSPTSPFFSAFFCIAVELLDLQLFCWAPLNIRILFRVFFGAPLNIYTPVRVFFWARIFKFEALDYLFFSLSLLRCAVGQKLWTYGVP